MAFNELVEKTKQTPIEIALGVDEEGNTTAKKLYSFLELNPSNYAKWVRNNITENPFAEENVDYFHSSLSTSEQGRGNFATDYKLTSHFAKKLSMKGNGEKAEQAREYFTTVEEKAKEAASKPLTGAALLLHYAQQFYEQEQRMNEIESSVKELEAKVTTHDESFYTIAGYAGLKGLKVDISKANILGRRASKISRELGYDIGKTQDPRFGQVNTYHLDILNEIFENYR